MGSLAYYPLLLIVLVVLASAIKILREYERAVVFQLGRFWKVKGLRSPTSRSSTSTSTKGWCGRSPSRPRPSASDAPR